MSDTSSDTQMEDAYTIGAILRGAREANGESVEDVARMLRINWRYLQALEEGQFHELPGTVYAIGFIRTYADHLGMDSAHLIDQYKAISSSSPSKTSLEFPEPIPESGLPGGAILFAGIVVAILAYGGWYLATEEDSFLARMVSPVPEHLADNDQVAEEAEESNAAMEQPATVEETVEPITDNQEATSTEIGEQVEDAAVVEKSDEPVEESVAEISETVSTITEETADASQSEEDGAVEPTEEVNQEVTEEITSSIETTTEQAEETVDEQTTEIVEETAEITTAEIVEEAIVEEAVEETVGDMVEEGAVAEVSEVTDAEPEIDSVSVASAVEETDAQSLNEAQLHAVQESLSESENVTVESAAETVPTPEHEPGVAHESAEDSATAESEASDDVAGETAGQTADNQQGSDIADSEETQIAAIPAETAVTETAAGRIYGDQGNARIIVRAKANSWIQVRNDNSGQLLLTRLLRAGDEYHVPDQRGLSLLTGDAGALEILVDGSTVPDIGSSGDVRRNVALDADRLKSGDAAN